MKKKSLLKVSSGVFFILGLVALIFAANTIPANAAKTINIGYPCSVTGPAAMEFMIAADIVKGRVAEINASGGINGRKIKIFTADDGNDPAKAVANVKRFVGLNGCTSIICSGTSTINYALKSWAEANHVPVICGNAQSDGLLVTKQEKAWWFSTDPHTRHYSGGMCVRAKELGHKKIGIEYSSLAWGVDGLKMLKKFFPKYGLEFAGAVALEPKSKDATIQAKELRDTGAELVMMVEYAAEIGVFARALKEIGWNPHVINMSGGMMSDALKIYPKELFEGWDVVLMSDMGKPESEKVFDKYKEYTGKSTGQIAITCVWDAINVLLEGIRLSGNPDDPKAIRDAFYKVKLPMAGGKKGAVATYSLGKNCTITPEDVAIGVIKSGKMW